MVQYHAVGGNPLGGLSDQGFYKIKDKLPGNKVTLCGASGACAANIDLTGESNSVNFFTTSSGSGSNHAFTCHCPGTSYSITHAPHSMGTLVLSAVDNTRTSAKLSSGASHINGIYDGFQLYFTSGTGAPQTMKITSSRSDHGSWFLTQTRLKETTQRLTPFERM